jgi:hypothetical protein
MSHASFTPLYMCRYVRALGIVLIAPEWVFWGRTPVALLEPPMQSVCCTGIRTIMMGNPVQTASGS